ncbi:MAG: DUF6763 family protein [Pseudomonadota bacterium]
MTAVNPRVGRWYRRPDRGLFEVVAVDEAANTIEIQYFDGTVAEIDAENWGRMIIQAVAAPEDWSGAMDVNREDVVDDVDGRPPHDWSDPLEVIERQRDHGIELIPD